jgi:hypothetical protein
LAAEPALFTLPLILAFGQPLLLWVAGGVELADGVELAGVRWAILERYSPA